jgi:hypothetical protein
MLDLNAIRKAENATNTLQNKPPDTGLVKVLSSLDLKCRPPAEIDIGPVLQCTAEARARNGSDEWTGVEKKETNDKSKYKYIYCGIPGALPRGKVIEGWYVRRCWAHTETAPLMVPVRIDGINTSALQDSGSMVTLVHPQWLTREGKEEPGDEEVTVSCVHRDTKRYPTAPVRITTPKGGVPDARGSCC